MLSSRALPQLRLGLFRQNVRVLGLFGSRCLGNFCLIQKCPSRFALCSNGKLGLQRKRFSVEASPAASASASAAVDNAESDEGLEKIAPKFYICHQCKVRFATQSIYEKHLRGKRHENTIKAQAAEGTLIKSVGSQFGIYSQVDGANIEFDDRTGQVLIKAAEGAEGKFTIDITNSQAVVEKSAAPQAAFENRLAAAMLLIPLAEVKLSDPADVTRMNATNWVTIPSGESYAIDVTFKFDQVGKYCSPCVLKFERWSADKKDGPSAVFTIVRFLEFNVQNKLVEELQPETAYQPTVVRPEEEVIPAIPLVSYIRGHRAKKASIHELENSVPLTYDDVPPMVRRISKFRYAITPEMDQRTKQFCSKFRHSIRQQLTPQNYNEFFKHMLYIEELYDEELLVKFDLHDAKLTKVPGKNLLSLQVEHLPENFRPLIEGGRLFIRSSKDANAPVYEGCIHRINEENTALLGCDKSLDDEVDFGTFDVRFSLDRLSLRMQHRALHQMQEFGLHPMVFPTYGRPPMRPLFDGPIKCINPYIQKNKEQFQAVMEVLRGTCRPAPYLLFGPPGTGKTITIVECIQQVLENMRGSNVLACAPSNIAADRLAQELLRAGVHRSEILRMNAVGRDRNSIPKELLPVSNIHPQLGDTYFPSLSDICSRRVIVTTLVTSGRLVSADIPSGHFSHIFIDEAGQAPEPEVLIPIAGLYNPLKCRGIVVLAGDPQQLGPLVQSTLAERCGFGVSLLERLMRTNPVYARAKDGTYNPRMMTKLLSNFRSHEALIQVPNRLFYDDDLKPCGNYDVVYSLSEWHDLPKHDFPLIFHGVTSEEKRNADNPSYFNPAEISVVMNYVDKLLAKRIKAGQTVRAKDIGIISPYRAQVYRIRNILSRDVKYDGITVGSVEEYQGSERRVIILTTVRTNSNYIVGDARTRIGFLKNPKRFNTAITRAQALLIVIGDPNVLQSDLVWRVLIQYCYDNGAYRGVTFKPSFEKGEDMNLKEFVGKVDTIVAGAPAAIGEKPKISEQAVAAATN